MGPPSALPGMAAGAVRRRAHDRRPSRVCLDQHRISASGDSVGGAIAPPRLWRAVCPLSARGALAGRPLRLLIAKSLTLLVGLEIEEGFSSRVSFVSLK